MATIDLGKIKMVWRGAYNNATAYTIDDAVSLNGTSYICIAATTGNTPPNATYWNVLAQGGTDLGATLSNNQIAIKNNSGNIAGVNIGNAGEFLKVSSGATGYEFGAVSSDFVKLLEINQTTAVGSIFIQQFITSTYKHYKVILNNVVHSASGNQSEMRLLTGTNTQYQSNNYYGLGQGYYKQYAGGSGSSHDQFSTHGVNYFRFTPGFNPGDDWGSMTIMDLYAEANKRPMMVSNSIHPRHSNQYLYQGTGGMIVDDTSQTWTGLLLYPSSGANITNADITIYGLKD